jgi:SAM-dependent methyltransferase
MGMVGTPVQNRIVSHSVDADRWQQAQRWEREHWIAAQRHRARWGKNVIWRALHVLGRVPRHRGDDWNRWWEAAFDGYSFLPDHVGNTLEVGCGPYTNVRLIGNRCTFDHLVLSDPLIRTYAKFKLTFVSQMYRDVACVLDDHPLEELPFADDYFDLTVMINVLDHVRDARACMENLIRVTRRGGFLIIGQDLSDDDDSTALLEEDDSLVGHPIKLDEDWFRPYLDSGFQHVKYEILPREQGRAPELHCGTLLFAATKR